MKDGKNLEYIVLKFLHYMRSIIILFEGRLFKDVYGKP